MFLQFLSSVLRSWYLNMENRFFSPADFSDFERSEEEIQTALAAIVSIPNEVQMNIIIDKLESEFKLCTSGTSNLTNRAVQKSSTTITINCLTTMLKNFNEKTAINFVEAVRQDYGIQVAEWCAIDVLSSFVPMLVETVSKWREHNVKDSA